MIIKIAICDDETYMCSQLESMLDDILTEMGVIYEIETFGSGESFCSKIEKGRFDLVFLDIELPNINGVAVGKYIREIMKDELVQIVYISGKDGYAMELFQFRPMNFLKKPLKQEEVKGVIQKYEVVTEQNYPRFSYKKGSKYYQILMSDIMYFENVNRKVIICTKDYEDEFYGSIEDIYDEVRDKDFLLIHKSIIINYRFVREMKYKEVTMANGKIHPISQGKRPEVRTKYMQMRKRVR